MPNEHLPDLAHAGDWLEEIAETLATAASKLEVAGFPEPAQDLRDKRATLNDVIARAAITHDANEVAQAMALLRRVQVGGPVSVYKAPAGGLPDGYLLVIELINGSPAGFECGIAPDGRVSS